EPVALMAVRALDALIMEDVSRGEKERLGRLAYVRSGVKAMQAARVPVKIRVDGDVWFEGKASNVLVGNVGTIAGGIPVFWEASAADGRLEGGVVPAKTPCQWLRVFTRASIGRVTRSPHVH